MYVFSERQTLLKKGAEHNSGKYLDNVGQSVLRGVKYGSGCMAQAHTFSQALCSEVLFVYLFFCLGFLFRIIFFMQSVMYQSVPQKRHAALSSCLCVVAECCL